MRTILAIVFTLATGPAIAQIIYLENNLALYNRRGHVFLTVPAGDSIEVMDPDDHGGWLVAYRGTTGLVNPEAVNNPDLEPVLDPAMTPPPAWQKNDDLYYAAPDRKRLVRRLRVEEDYDEFENSRSVTVSINKEFFRVLGPLNESWRAVLTYDDEYGGPFLIFFGTSENRRVASEEASIGIKFTNRDIYKITMGEYIYEELSDGTYWMAGAIFLPSHPDLYDSMLESQVLKIRVYNDGVHADVGDIYEREYLQVLLSAFAQANTFDPNQEEPKDGMLKDKGWSDGFKY